MAIISFFKLIEVIGIGFRVMNLTGIMPCPICGGVLGGFGKRKRKYIDADGIRQILIIRRLRCCDCKHIHHELPDILVPYKRHCAETIEKIIDDRIDDADIGELTIRRIRNWWNDLRVYKLGILASLSAKFGMAFGNPPKLKEVVRALANANLWVSTRSATTPA